MLVDVCRPERLAWERCLARADDPSRGSYADALLSYLARFPFGARNRQAAERVEQLIAAIHSTHPGQAAHLRWALRALRDPYMPTVRSNSWVAGVGAGSPGPCSALPSGSSVPDA